ncbi:phosphoribosyltransferase [Kitasatospora sp. NPDC002227]|uniref:phosphoribosyltransferase n=1 Tax=Kitasatospora sp. NPDC002227 TaxID=3154773 RepID=UPI00331F56D5
MANSVRAVVFDRKAVFQTGTMSPHPGMAQVLHLLDKRGIGWVLLTTDPFDARQCALAGLPEPTLHLSKGDIPGQKNRGSDLWITEVAERLGLPVTQLALVGATDLDWRTGVNAGVVFIRALWATGTLRQVALTAQDPAHLYWILDRHLLHEPQWLFAMDDEARNYKVRSLFPPEVRFDGTNPSSFTLQHVFTYDIDVTAGNRSARDILMLHVLCAAYLEGLLPARAWFCVYPSSTPGAVNHQLADFIKVAKVMTGASYKDDLLVRATQATDTSRARAQNRHGEVTIATQANTVHLNPAHRNTLARGKTVVVFDDFTTEGMSLDWARSLLTEAGATQVIGVTIGKYRKPYTFFSPRPGVEIDPFTPNTSLTPADFTVDQRQVPFGTGPVDLVAETMRRAVAGDTGLPEIDLAAATTALTPAENELLDGLVAASKVPRPVPTGTVTPMLKRRNGRQQHIMDFLDKLAGLGLLTWRADYHVEQSMPLWWVSLDGKPAVRWYNSREVETLIGELCAVAGIIWEPVLATFGETQRLEAVARIEARRKAAGR